MRGSVIRRGKTSWRIKFDAGVEDGKRKFHVETIRATRKDAEAALAKRLSELADGRYIAPTATAIKRVTFHALRHTHITHLLRNGVPVHVVAERAGHANPTITLTTYAHLIGGDDERAADVVDVMLRRLLK
jgi:integrase